MFILRSLAAVDGGFVMVVNELASALSLLAGVNIALRLIWLLLSLFTFVLLLLCLMFATESVLFKKLFTPILVSNLTLGDASGSESLLLPRAPSADNLCAVDCAWLMLFVAALSAKRAVVLLLLLSKLAKFLVSETPGPLAQAKSIDVKLVEFILLILLMWSYVLCYCLYSICSYYVICAAIFCNRLACKAGV